MGLLLISAPPLLVSGNYDIIPSLIEVGCPLDSADSAGATAIHYAVQHTAEPYPELLGKIT